MIVKKNFLYIMSMFYIFVTLLLSASQNSLLSIAFIVFMVFFMTFFYKNKRVSSKSILIFIVTIIIIAFSLFFSKYGMVDTIVIFSVLFIGIALFDNYREKKYYDYILCFLLVIMIGVYLLIQFYYNYSTFNFFENIDKNYICVICFLLICYSLKLKNGIVQIFGIIFSLIIGSRLIIISIILLYILYYFFKKHNIKFKVKPFYYFLILIFQTVLVLIISYVMATSPYFSSVSNYHDSFNDNSNAIRTRSNLYAFNIILNSKELFVYGYDNNIRQEIGARGLYDSNTYMGYRVVQPHNFLLNIYLRYGLILTLVYLYVLSIILSRFSCKDNYPIIICYLFINMFMHSLFSSIYLLLFLMVISIRDDNMKEVIS